MRGFWHRAFRLGCLAMLQGAPFFLQFGALKSFVTFREGLIEANREGLTSSLGYLALHLAGVSWGSDLLFLASTPDHLFTSAGLLVVWLVTET